MRLALPGGLSGGRCAALADLVAEICAVPFAPPEPPMLAAATLFADAEVARGLAFPAPGDDAILIHDYQGLDIRAPLPTGTALAAEAEVRREAARADYRIGLGPAEAAVTHQELRLGLRIAPPAELRDAAGLAMRAGPAPDRQTGAAVGAAAIARYCEISGDRNPLHLDAGYVARRALPAALVPGLLLLSLFEPDCRALTGRAPVALKARFLAPAYRDRPLTLALTRRGETRARGFVLTAPDTAAAIADFEFG